MVWLSNDSRLKTKVRKKNKKRETKWEMEGHAKDTRKMQENMET